MSEKSKGHLQFEGYLCSDRWSDSFEPVSCFRTTYYRMSRRELWESEPREQAAWRTGSITVSMLERGTVFYPLCATYDPCDSGSFVFKSPCIKVPDGTFRDESKTQVWRDEIL